MTEPEVVDRAALANLLEMVGGDTAFLHEMIDEFLADSAHLLTTLRQAASEGNAGEVRRAAHSLKSNSATFGAHHLAELCRELEQRGNHGTLGDVEPLLAQIEAAYEPVVRSLALARATEPAA